MLRPDATSTPPLWYAYRQPLSASLVTMSNLFILCLVFLPPPLEGRHYLLLWLALLDLEILSSSLRHRGTYYLERSAQHRAFVGFWMGLTTSGLVWWGGSAEQRWMGATVVALSVVEYFHGMECARRFRRAGGAERETESPASEPQPIAKPDVDGTDRSI